MVRPLTNKMTQTDKARTDETRRRIDTEDVERTDNPIVGVVEGVLLTLIFSAVSLIILKLLGVI